MQSKTFAIILFVVFAIKQKRLSIYGLTQI